MLFSTLKTISNMAKVFKANVGSKVSKKEAKEWIAKYDREMRKDKKNDTKSLFYGRDVLLKILSQEGSTGITFFFALKPNAAKKDTVQLVLVPTKEDGTLIWPADGASATLLDDATAYDNAIPCPPYCPK